LLARGLPTIADAVLGDPSDLSTYVSSPEAIAAAQAQTQRGRNAGTPIACSVVFGPATEEHASPNFVTAALYRRVIDALAREFDIVVVDTQTAEMWDTSGLFDGVVRPMMAQRQAWLLGVTPLDGPSIKNLGARYTKWREAGSLPADRVITVLGSSARENGASAHDPEQVASAFARFGFVAGCIPYSEEVEHAFENGSIPAASAAVRPVMHAVLFRVTGLATFAPPDDAEGSKRSRRQKGSKRRIFRRKG
jgi:hypothetical protein